MPTHVALLAGVNVGRHRRLAMSDLREIVTGLGYGEVATYIQSGNVVFSCTESDTLLLSTTLEAAIAARLDVRPDVVVLSRGHLRSVVAGNPFPQEKDPKCLHVVFHRAQMDADTAAFVSGAERRARSRGSRDEAATDGSSLYLRTPDGLGRSLLAAELARPRGERAVRAVTTMRNWTTVTRLLELAGG